MTKKSVLLIIMDGFGLSPVTEGNATYNASTPFLDSVMGNFPTCLLDASGTEVGLDWGEMGNSEVGHFNMGTGRVVAQDFFRINRAIEDGSFFQNESLLEAINHVKKNKSTLHLVGLLSSGGVHASIEHIKALLDFCKKQKVDKLALHLFTDGRDTSPKVAPHLLDIIEEKIKTLRQNNWKIATLIGRFYAMDRDNHWERVQQAYDLIASGVGEQFHSYKEALENYYSKNIFDEELPAIVLDKNYLINNDDAMILFNFRRDRTHEIVEALVDPDFKKFDRKKFIKNLFFTGFVNYGEEPTDKVKTAFFSQKIINQIPDVCGKNKLKHLHIAETEKYAHVTYFFNGGIEKPFNYEERILIPSPRVESYAQVPEMSAKKITDKFISFYNKEKPNFTVLNFANPDMVGHTGNYKATIKAVETVDSCVKKIFENVKIDDLSVIITADHGNAEQMINPETNEVDKEHTVNPVPFILIQDLLAIKEIKITENRNQKLIVSSGQTVGVLADIAATIVDLLELKKPKEITGTSLRKL